MTPHCYDRPPFKSGYWAPNGHNRLRWVAFRMTRECMAWAAPEGCRSGPEVEGWNCSGCKHDPRKE